MQSFAVFSGYGSTNTQSVGWPVRVDQLPDLASVAARSTQWVRYQRPKSDACIVGVGLTEALIYWSDEFREYVVEHSAVTFCGYGKTQQEAIDDFIDKARSVVEAYKHEPGDPSRYSDLLRMSLSYCQSAIDTRKTMLSQPVR